MTTMRNRSILNMAALPGLKKISGRWLSFSPIRYLANILASSLIDLHARLNGYKFVLAATEAEKEEAYRLRYQVYVEAGYIAADTGHQSRLTDNYDEVSAIFLAYYQDQCVGTLRLTSLNYGSNTQDYFNVSLDREPHQIADIGKFAVASRQRSRARIAGFGLVRIAYIYSMQNDIQVWLGCTPTGLLRSFRNFCPAHILPQGPATEQHLKNRARRSGYFEKHGDNIKPFQMLMSEMNGLYGLYKFWWPLLKAKLNSYTKTEKLPLRNTRGTI